MLDLQRNKEDYRLIGRRVGKVIKISREESVPAHGFVSNNQSAPVLFFDVSLIKLFYNFRIELIT